MNGSLPISLSNKLDDLALRITNDGDLPCHSRKELMLLIEGLSIVEHVDAGYLRQARLALVCAKRVVSYISSSAEVRASAASVINNGLLALKGKYEMTILEAENGDFHTKVIDELEKGEDAFVSVYAGMACFAAVNTILYNVDFEKLGVDEEILSPDEWDLTGLR